MERRVHRDCKEVTTKRIVYWGELAEEPLPKKKEKGRPGQVGGGKRGMTYRGHWLHVTSAKVKNIVIRFRYVMV